MIRLSQNNIDFLVKVLQVAIPLTLPLAMISGLFMAPWIAIMMLSIILISRPNIATARSYLTPIEHTLILWSIASCFWSISPIDSTVASSQLIFTILVAHIIINKIHLITILDQNAILKIILAIISACIIFLIEAYSDGFIYRLVRSFTQPNSESNFVLSWLDRGCGVLALSSWALIYYFIKSKQIPMAITLYIAILSVLFISDSTASFIGFILGAIAYIALYFSPRIISVLLALCVIAYMIAMPIFSIKQDPYLIVEKYDTIPISYAHRLFIWKFTADKSMESPFIGHGIGTAKALTVQESDIVHYDGHALSPLPRHPHNNILQIWLELGAVGMAIFGAYIWNILSKFRNIARGDHNFGAAIHAVFINYFFIGMISFNMWQSWWLMITLFMVLLMNFIRNYE